jgi:hypothetical protein
MNIYPPKPASSGKATMIAMASAAQSSGGSSSVTITSAPTTGTVGTALSLVGTVSPTATAVQVGLSTSNTTAPTTWTAAMVSGSGWTASITPSAAGTYYIWAEQTSATSVQTVSSAVTIAASGGSTIALTSPPTTGTTGTALTINGTVGPSGTAVQVGLSTSNTTAPTSWTAATVSTTNWSVSITPSAAGTYYIWAEQTATPSVQAISAAVTISASSGTIALTSPPSSGTAGTAFTVTGTVSPNATAVQVGLSTTNTTAPTSFTAATVTSGTWTVSLTEATAGTYYIWAEQTATPSVKVISSALTISGSNTFSVISGSGNGNLTGATITTGYSAVDFGSHIAVGATDVVPNINITGGSGTQATAKFWWDTNNTGTTVGSTFANSAGYSGGNFFFYANSSFQPPTGVPVVSSAGTYYGKYAVYDSTNTLLGVITTSAITIS